MEALSLEVLELPLGGQAEEGVEGVATDVEGCHTSGCSNTQSVSKQKPQAVYEV